MKCIASINYFKIIIKIKYLGNAVCKNVSRTEYFRQTNLRQCSGKFGLLDLFIHLPLTRENMFFMNDHESWLTFR